MWNPAILEAIRHQPPVFRRKSDGSGEAAEPVHLQLFSGNRLREDLRFLPRTLP